MRSSFLKIGAVLVGLSLGLIFIGFGASLDPSINPEDLEAASIIFKNLGLLAFVIGWLLTYIGFFSAVDGINRSI